MPASAANTTIQLFGSNTANRVPTAAQLGPRETFINTYNSYHVETASVSSGGAGFTVADVGKVVVVSIPGLSAVHPLEIIISEVSGAGVITDIQIFNYGGYTAPPATSPTIVPITVPGSAGINASISVTFFDTPALEDGGGMYVGDATQAGEIVKVVGSLAPQDHSMVNITGGNISGVNMSNVNLVGGASAITGLTNVSLDMSTITTSTIDGSTITNTAFNSGTIGTAMAPLSNAYITSLNLPNTQPPVGVTGVGVLILGSDGRVYATPTPTVTGITVTGNAQINGGLGVGSGINNVTAGSIRTTNDITAFAAS